MEINLECDQNIRELSDVKARWPFSDFIFQCLAMLALMLALAVLVVLLGDLFFDGARRLNWDFISNFPSRFADKAGIKSALIGSFYLMILIVVFSMPLGIGAAIYLEEYAPDNRFTRLIELNIANLAGVPSIIYGILGLQIFIRALNFDRSLLSGALTLTILILPVIIISAREAIRAVPKSLREASLALGAGKWQTIQSHVLPVAMPGIMTGCILAFSRAIGETAPLITIGALTYVAFLPDSLFSPFTALPIQAYNWISRPQAAFHENAAAAMLILLSLLFCMNALAIFLRIKFQKRLK